MTAAQHAAPGQSFDSHADFYRNSAYAAFPQEHRASGSFGVKIFCVDQAPINMIDPPSLDFVFACQRTANSYTMLDIGDGQREFYDHQADSMLVVQPDTELHTIVDGDHRMTFATIAGQEMRWLLDRHGLNESIFARYAGGCGDVNARAVGVLDAMWRVCENFDSAASLYFDGLTLQFLAALGAAEALSPTAGARSDTRIVRVIDYIETHYGEALNIGELADIACLSPGHFSRTFKATTGDPVWTYVQRRRCERAKEMLQTTQLSIAEIAYRCGFANQGHLTRTFGQQFGMTPNAARRETME